MNKNFRIFYKKINDPVTAKSCEIQEIEALSIKGALNLASVYAATKDFRVVLVAEITGT